MPRTKLDIHMPLFGPGMTMELRAGLFGLTASLVKAVEEGVYLPGNIDVGSYHVHLSWDNLEDKDEFLKNLFEFSFQQKNEKVYFPAQWEGEINEAVQNEMLKGLDRTLLAHPRTCSIEYKDITDDDGKKLPSIARIKQGLYTHQRSFEGSEQELSRGEQLVNEDIVDMKECIFPWAAKYHSKLVQLPIELALPAFFFMVGSVSLPYNQKKNDKMIYKGIIVIPEVDSLDDAESILPAMIPETRKDCWIHSPEETVLSFVLHLKSLEWTNKVYKSVKGVRCIEFEESGRYDFIPCMTYDFDVSKNTEGQLDKYKKATMVTAGSFKFQSSVAKNCFYNLPWYSGFCDLMIDVYEEERKNLELRKKYPSKPIKNAVKREKKGVIAMMEDKDEFPLEENEQRYVNLIHETMNHGFGKIAAYAKGKKRIYRNEKMMEDAKRKVRRSLNDQSFRATVLDFIDRHHNGTKDTREEKIKAMYWFYQNVNSKNWRDVKDLTRLAFETYVSPEKEKTNNQKEAA